MPLVCPGIESSTDFPQLNGFISGTTDEVIAVHYKIHKTNVMIMPMESLTADKVII